MDGYLTPILIAAVTGLFAWGIVCFIQGMTDGEKKKLAERLGSEDRMDSASTTRRSIVMQQMESSGLPPGMAEMKIFQGLNRLLIQAFPEWSLLKFLYVGGWDFSFKPVHRLVVADSVFMGLAAGAIGAYLPFFTVSSRRGKRQKKIANQIPDALDFLSRILRAGHSLTTGLQMMGEELPMPMGTEFRRCYDQHSLGQPLEDCLKSMASRIESTDFAFFITAVLIQRQSGGDLSEVLKNISGMIRQRIRLQQHVKAKTAEGRFTGYILVAFPAVMFMVAYVMNPDYAGILLHTTTGPGTAGHRVWSVDAGAVCHPPNYHGESMSDQILIFFCVAGTIGLLAYCAMLMIGTSGNGKLRDRLTGKSQTDATQPQQRQGMALLKKMGNVAAEPFMPKTREAQSELRSRLGFAGIYSNSALKLVTGCKGDRTGTRTHRWVLPHRVCGWFLHADGCPVHRWIGRISGTDVLAEMENQKQPQGPHLRAWLMLWT